VITVRVDRERCASSGNCAFAQPTVFDQDETDGRVILLEESPDDVSVEDMVEVADLCPGQAIAVVTLQQESGSRA